MLLATKLKNRVLLAAASSDLPLQFHLRNTSVNGRKVGCCGFIVNTQSGSCVYVDTEKSIYGPLSDKCLYRYARDTRDFASTGLKNGWNRFCSDDDLPGNVIRMLREGKGELK